MAVRIIMPKLGDFMTEGIVTFVKSKGDSVNQGEVILEIESEKLNYELEAAANGVFHTVVSDGTTVPVDDLIGYLLDSGEEPPVEESKAVSENISASPKRSESKTSISKDSKMIPSTPGARKLASKLDVDLSLVTPTGPRGRVVEADIRAFSESGSSIQESIPVGLPEEHEVIEMKGMRKAIAENMKRSLDDSAQLSFFFEVDVTDAQTYRRDVGVELTAFLIKASGAALSKVPSMNSVISNDSILVFDKVNIAMAVALDDGLIVPVIEDVNSKSINEISEEVKSLSELARDGKLKSEQLRGGTFTISVLGSVDGFTPILNQGQVAILGIGRSQKKPVVVKNDIAIKEIMTISLTVDHQAIDGAIAANFCRRLQQLIEKPSRVK
ncbi:MAG: dihydrolipoamide acetyltransferase family protein [Dehalococcoidia bacterium]